MAFHINQDICSGCHTCELYCPVGAIRMNFSKYQTDADKCVSCGTCAQHCHNAAIYDLEKAPEAPTPHEKIFVNLLDDEDLMPHYMENHSA